MFAHGGAHGHVLESRDSQSRIQYARPDTSRHKNSVGQIAGLKQKPGNKDKKRIAQQGKSLSVDSGTKNAVKTKHVSNSGKSASVDSGPNSLAQNLTQKASKNAHRRSLDASTMNTTKASPKTERPKTVSPKSSPKNQPLKPVLPPPATQPQDTSCFGCLPGRVKESERYKPGWTSLDVFCAVMPLIPLSAIIFIALYVSGVFGSGTETFDGALSSMMFTMLIMALVIVITISDRHRRKRRLERMTPAEREAVRPGLSSDRSASSDGFCKPVSGSCAQRSPAVQPVNSESVWPKSITELPRLESAHERELAKSIYHEPVYGPSRLTNQ